MKTHEITTSKCEFVVVERKDDLPILTFISNMHDLGLRKYICKLSQSTEEDAKLIVDEDNDYGVTLYQNYATTSMRYFDEQITAIESLHSLLKSKGIEINNGNWYLFKKI